jgi:hypothetical protein
VTPTKHILAALALIGALPLAARADGGFQREEGWASTPWTSAPDPLMRRGYRYPPRYADPRYELQARQGLLLSVGVGGGSLYLSDKGPGRFGAADLDFRIGYGFSDRFQMFLDFNAGSSYNGEAVGSWTWTVRGQTLLIGDRAGNGLNVNFGAGFGGLTYNAGYPDRSSGPTGFALAGGLSYDARLTRWFSVSPELFVTWHQVPNVPGVPDDASSIYGIRLNRLWYLH